MRSTPPPARDRRAARPWPRRRALAALASLGLDAAVGTRPAAAQGPIDVALAVPGPRSSVSLPLELAGALALDRDAGVALRLRFVGGGGVVIQDIRTRNAEFGVLGLPAVVRANLQGGPRLVALAAVDDLPLYTLVVRADLRAQVRRIADLAGRPLGVHSSSLQARTTSHQLAEYLLARHGVDLGSVKVVAAGQSWDTQAAMLRARTVDATLCDEPFATRMESEGLAFKLFSTGDPADAARTPGAGFLRAVLVGLADRVEADPERAARVVGVVQRALAWIASHPASEMADRLSMTGAERDAFLAVARAYPRQYSRDGAFSTAQLAETALFFRASNTDLPNLERLDIASMVVDRWVGRRP